MRSFRDCWSSHQVGDRRVDAFSPAPKPTAAVIWLHGYDEAPIRGRPAFETVFAEQELLVVCPSGGQTWWLDLPTPGFAADVTPASLVTHLIPTWIDETWSVSPPQFALAGVGMGGQGAINLGFRHARNFPVVAAISPDIDFHQWHGQGTPLDQLFSSGEDARQQTATLHLHPLNWPRHLLMVCDPDDAACFEGAERLASKLISSGIPFEQDLRFRGGGHTWTYFEQMIPQVARFLGEHLRSLGGSPEAQNRSM